jgi:hypothetical protein
MMDFKWWRSAGRPRVGVDIIDINRVKAVTTDQIELAVEVDKSVLFTRNRGTDGRNRFPR